MVTTKVALSGAPSGVAILVVQTATPGTAVHATSSTSGVIDEVWIWANNSDSSDRLLTIEWGGVSSPTNVIQQTIPLKSGANLVVPGLILTGGLLIKAFAASGSVVTVMGYVNRITP